MPTDSVDNIIKEFEEQRQGLQERLRLLDTAEETVIAALAGTVNHKRPKPRKREPSVPDGLYENVLRYLQEHPDSRQADIAAGLDINSGLVSQAVQIALEKGEAEADRRGRGALYRASDPTENDGDGRLTKDRGKKDGRGRSQTGAGSAKQG